MKTRKQKSLTDIIIRLETPKLKTLKKKLLNYEIDSMEELCDYLGFDYNKLSENGKKVLLKDLETVHGNFQLKTKKQYLSL